MLRSPSAQQTLLLRVFLSGTRGALAGIVGGIAFFLVWLLAAGPQVVQVLSMIALGVMHTKNPILGFIDHFVISAIIGAIYALVLSNLVMAHRYTLAPLFGLLNGVIWWVLGGLVILPLLLGFGPQFAAAFTPTFVVDLIAHIIYGIVTALVFTYLSRRAAKVPGNQSLT
jgi:uncharacterized membrane protein YagU involved in acid resistance